MDGTLSSSLLPTKMAEANSPQAGPSAPKADVKAMAREVPPFLKPLQFMGVPRGVLTWKPRLPSRNWSIFIAVSTTLTSLYVYDRRECNRIQDEYKQRVSHLAQQPMHPSEYPRKVFVYTAKSPGDEDPEKSFLFFRKYVKVRMPFYCRGF